MRPTPMWVLIPNHTHLPSEYPNQDLRRFGTHGNATVFFQYPPQLMDFAAACFVCFAVAGVFGNLVSVLALSRSRRLRNATTAFIVNLCVADLLFCGFSMPLSALTFLERDWNYGELLCKLFPLVRYSNGAVSLFSVIAITINRYILIVHPSIYKSFYTPRNISLMITAMWASSLALLLFPFLEIWGRFGYDPTVGTCSILRLNGQSPKMLLYVVAFGLPSTVFVVCYSRIFWVVRRASRNVVDGLGIQPGIETFVTFSSKKDRFGYDPTVGTCSILHLNGQSPKMGLYVVAFGLPSMVFVVCYSRIFWVVRGASRNVVDGLGIQPGIETFVTFSSKKKGVFWRKSYRHSEMQTIRRTTTLRRSRQQELKVLKVILVIFLTFILCYFPVSFVKIFRKEDDLPVLNILGYLGVYFSNIVNPVIYIVMSDEYRKAYLELVCPAKSAKLALGAVVV